MFSAIAAELSSRQHCRVGAAMSPMMRNRASVATALTRRRFLLLSAVTGGGLLLHGVWRHDAAAEAAAAGPVTMNAWLIIAPDSQITIVSPQAEMGQGIQATLPAVLADELGADCRRVTIENGPTDPAYRNPCITWQFTGNRESSTAFLDLMRNMGASAREMLIGAAATRWKVPPGECDTTRGYVIHAPTRRHMAFGRIAAEAAARPVPRTPALKASAHWT
jgi:isoquinoline 1-oxidoreductase subunit beta